jgi:hypothetical protein
LGCTSLSSWFHRGWVQLSWTHLFWARRRRRNDGGRTRFMAACGLRPRVHAAILIAVAATMTIVGAGIASIDQANAAPMCPGPTTADGLACCTPGSTPTGDDTCQLPGGGVAASCALSQLTSSGTCCPVSSSPQSDGTCQPAGGFASAPGCPLGQLGKSGLSCCPTGLVPQADGSCQQSTAQQPTTMSFGPSPCPAGLSVGADQTCYAQPAACPAGLQFEDPNTTGYGCCPAGAQSMEVGGSRVCVESTIDNGNVVQATVNPVAPTCPPGSTLFPRLPRLEFFTVPRRRSALSVMCFRKAACAS